MSLVTWPVSNRCGGSETVGYQPACLETMAYFFMLSNNNGLCKCCWNHYSTLIDSYKGKIM